MLRLVWEGDRAVPRRSLFHVGLIVWFFLGVVLSYWWCFETGTDPSWCHTPSVVIFIRFNAAQSRALRRLGLLGAAREG